MRIIRRDGQVADLALGLSGLAAVLLTLGVVMLSTGADASGPVCLWHRLTGLPCPTCGTTRALRALLDGHAQDAFRLQPLTMGGGLLVLGLSALDLVNVLIFRRAVRISLTTREGRLFAGVALLAVTLNWLYLLHTLR